MIEDKISEVSYNADALNTLSFFSGALGLDLGLEEAGLNILLACEFDKHCRGTISLNKPELGLIGDIRNYNIDQILEYAGLDNKDQVDVIVGGPPCQAFSTAGKRLGFADERGNVFLKFIDVIEKIRPRYFVMENVRGLMSSILQIPIRDEIIDNIPDELLKVKGSSLLYIILRLEKAGYNINFDLYNAANYGTPQKRERIVIIGTLGDEKVPLLEPTHAETPSGNLKPWVNINEVINNLGNDPLEHIKYSPERAYYYGLLKSGENWRNLPEELQIKALGKAYYLGGGKTGFLRRLDWNKPSPTLVTNPAMPATDLCHPDEIRPLSVEEYKIIQQFPDHWVFSGKTLDKYKQIGNAVPTGLGQAIGNTLINHSNHVIKNNYSDFKQTKYKNTKYQDFITSMFKNVERNLFANKI
ncbi:DNA cytosine methyltransferase [Chryseobacterium sp. c4a]|uniref:DNA cytosine methyltransferase n=1 Tax=Chryseobacterium sp. c4a TaxID=1573582 RepID=UPI001359B2D2|nr:DNA cytosine methyltransferase [Chryseobacterium sp. c4a]